MGSKYFVPCLYWNSSDKYEDFRTFDGQKAIGDSNIFEFTSNHKPKKNMYERNYYAPAMKKARRKYIDNSGTKCSAIFLPSRNSSDPYYVSGILL